jgi:ketosteroid isomerase-like protein
MSEQENVRLIQAFFDAFSRGDITAVLGFCAEDFALQHPMPEGSWPGAGNLQGKRSFAEFIEGMVGVLDFEVLELREFIAQGEKVVVNLFEHVRSKATGRAFDNDYIHIFTVREGKIRASRTFEDTAPILAAMRLA